MKRQGEKGEKSEKRTVEELRALNGGNTGSEVAAVAGVGVNEWDQRPPIRIHKDLHESKNFNQAKAEKDEIKKLKW